MKKTRILLFVLIFMLSIPNVYGEEVDDVNVEGIEPYFTNIYTFHTAFDMTGGGKAIMSASLDGHDGSNSEIDVRLQRYSNGKWSTIKSFNSTSSTVNCGLSATYYVSSGYSYRAVFYGYIYNGHVILDHTNQTSQLEYY